MYKDQYSTFGRPSIAGAPSGTSYSFPILKPDEIINSLRELGFQQIAIHLSANNSAENVFNAPEKNKDLIRRIFEQLAEACLDISREVMSQPVFSGLEALSHPELHEESIPQLNSFRVIQKLMETCSISNFIMKDLLNPSSKRFCRQLSAIINFARYRQDRLELLQELQSKQKENLVKRSFLIDKREDLMKRLYNLREQASSEAEIISRLERECQIMENKLTNFMTKQNELRNEINHLKNENNDLKDEISSKSVILEEQTALKKKLTGQIVSSPDKYRKQIQDVGQALKNEQSDIKIAERKIKELMGWIVNIDEAQVEVTKALEGVAELRGEVEKEKMLSNENEHVLQQLQSKQMVLSEVEQNISHLHRQINRAEEKLQSIRKQSAIRDAEAREAIEDIHKQLIKAEQVKLKIKSKADKAESEAYKKHKELEMEINNMDKENQQIVESYKSLERAVICHLNNLSNAIDISLRDTPAIENVI